MLYISGGKMDNLFEDLKDFIDIRIDKDIQELGDKEDYKILCEDYNNIYKSLYNSLDKDFKKNLEHLTSLLIDIYTEHIYVAYKKGFSDSLKLKNN